MTLAAPLFAWVAAGVAAATVALHLLAWRRPPESPLPTARFAPERPIRMVSRAVRPADLALLAVRVLLVLLVGIALAGPSIDARRPGAGRVIVVDRSASAGTGAEVASAARAAFRSGDAIVVFDSAAREVASPTSDSLGATSASQEYGSLSAALVVAVRAAARLERERDSVEIVVVSPFASHEIDAATRPIRATWHGPLRVLRASGAPNDTTSLGRPTVRAADGDAIAASLGLSPPFPGGASVRVVRDAPTAADSVWAREGRALVIWPVGASPTWQRHDVTDTAFAVTAPRGTSTGASGLVRSATVVARFARTNLPPPGRIIARWSDGEPAATEAALGAGCVRAVVVTVPVGDLPLTPAFQHFARRLAAPCGAAARNAPAPDNVLATVLPPTVPASERLSIATLAAELPGSRLAGWLLALALLLALAEMWIRRGASDVAA